MSVVLIQTSLYSVSCSLPTQVSLVLLSVFLTRCVIFSTLPVFALVVCFDAKINFDDNAEFRQKAVFAMDDMSESDPTETQAAKWDLKYIGLDGNIACFGKELADYLCEYNSLHINDSHLVIL